MAFVMAFLALGFLIGNLVGMTSASVVSALIPLLFAFGGGSAIAFLEKLNVDAQKRAAVAVMCLSLACLLGVYTGIFTTEYHLLSPRKAVPGTVSRLDNTYLKSLVISDANIIDQQLAKGRITLEEAYMQLKEAYRLAIKGTDK